jgi:hypothetical protein
MTATARLALARSALAQAHRAAGLARGSLASQSPHGAFSLGIPLLDAQLDGGFARGALYALSGSPGSGRASLALSWLASATRDAREPVAFIDGADALDPCALDPSLRRGLLWIRARSALEVLACAEQLLDAGGFAMVCLYLVDAQFENKRMNSNDPPARTVGPGHWARVAQRAAASRTVALSVLDEDDPRAPGPLARASLHARRAPARWGRDALLDGAEVELWITRNRRGPSTGHPASAERVVLRAP